MNILNSFLRTIFYYFFILFSFRIMGKKEISQLSISDLTISILMAELVAISIENTEFSVFITIIPVLSLVLLEIILSYYTLKHNRASQIIEGVPSVIINNGVLNIKEMIKNRYNINELLLALRNSSIASISDIKYAILETNGKLSIFTYDSNEYSPLPLIIDGVIDKKSLNIINKDEFWLKTKLSENKINIENLLYAFYKNNKIYIIKKYK